MIPRPSALSRSIAVVLASIACRSEPARAPETAPVAEPSKRSITSDPAASNARAYEASTGGATGGGLPPPPTTEAPSAAPAPPSESLREQAPLSDEQIAAVSVAVNGAEIEQAKLARTKARDPRVRKLAEMIFLDHDRARREQQKLTAKLKLQPADSTLSTELSAEASGTLATLKGASRNGFDGVYLEARVNAHRKLLDLLDAELGADAKNVDLKTHLQALRERVQTHLDEALKLQDALAGPK